MALDEIVAAPTSSIHLRRRLRLLLERLTQFAPPEAHAALQARLERLERAA